MPKEDDVGYGDCTPRKMADFSTIVAYHQDITQAVLNKHSNLYTQKYRYIDLTAGKGFSPNGIMGSPIAFLEKAERETFEIPYRADFIECVPKNIHELKTNVESEKARNDWKATDLHFHLGSYQDEIKKLLPHKVNGEFGLIFIDPTGKIPDFQILHYVADMRPKMEILIYLASTNVKRTYQYTEKRLTDYIDSIGKKHWLVRNPVSWDKFKWTFLLGSNALSLFGDYKSIDFFRLESQKGQQILEKINLTEKEQIESKQYKMWK